MTELTVEPHDSVALSPVVFVIRSGPREPILDRLPNIAVDVHPIPQRGSEIQDDLLLDISIGLLGIPFSLYHVLC